MLIVYYEDYEESIPLSQLDIHPDLLRNLADFGVISIQDEKISWTDLRRVNRLLRLRSLLGINLPGAAVIVDLLDQVEKLEREIKYLKQR
jgi:MerR family transcriptional regulator/heat shock protein HspR